MGTSLNLESNVNVDQLWSEETPPTLVCDLAEVKYKLVGHLRCEVMATVTNSPLHVHYGITLWGYLSETLVKDSHKRPNSIEKTQYRVLQVT